MNLDDLMAVWKLQDSAPLNGVNDTLLRLALRNDEAKLRALLRKGRRINYVVGAVLLGHMVYYLFLMSRYSQTGWDYVYPISGTAALLFWLALARRSYQMPTLREQSFGTSLRDQLNRHIAELGSLEKQYTSLSFLLSFCLPLLIGGIALSFTVVRAQDKPISTVWTDTDLRIVLAGLILFMVIVFAGAFWVGGRMWKRKYLPRKQRLEALLKELDEQG